MQILTSTDVALRLTSPWTETKLAQSEILINGESTGKVITGEVLETAVEWRGLRILFVTDNIPLEDYLRIYLLDAQWQIIDSASLGAMYSTGAFSGLELQPPDILRFNFIGGITWTMELLETARFRLPFTDPRGVSRPLSFSRRFNLKGRPLPESSRADAIER
ncbi:hypothetical protein [Massilia puerhi]|uniref:hypothetical protein n=1 Tax=Massilia puerhi TaxID=2681550 RepID=UPI00135B4497|nr:hypothetical protein [Massilia puerhi]